MGEGGVNAALKKREQDYSISNQILGMQIGKKGNEYVSKKKLEKLICSAA